MTLLFKIQNLKEFNIPLTDIMKIAQFQTLPSAVLVSFQLTHLTFLTLTKNQNFNMLVRDWSEK
jgi:hypothetical protein